MASCRSSHPSFKVRGGLWPAHCVQDSDGAQFHPGLQLPKATVMVTKGVRFDRDQYSVFDETGFADELHRERITRLWVGGLAEDVCVLATVLDARRNGFAVHLVRDATRPLSLIGGKKAEAAMRDAGAEIVDSYWPLAG